MLGGAGEAEVCRVALYLRISDFRFYASLFVGWFVAGTMKLSFNRLSDCECSLSLRSFCSSSSCAITNSGPGNSHSPSIAIITPFSILQRTKIPKHFTPEVHENEKCIMCDKCIAECAYKCGCGSD